MTFDWESFIGLGVTIPSINEQKAIVKVLQTADKEIQLLQTKFSKMHSIY